MNTGRHISKARHMSLKRGVKLVNYKKAIKYILCYAVLVKVNKTIRKIPLNLSNTLL